MVLALCAVAIVASLDLPHYGESRGPYEQRRAVEAVRARHATNLDAFVNFDIRGFDTLGEEFIFFVGIAGFSLLLAESRGELTGAARKPLPGREAPPPDPALKVFSIAFVPLAIAFGFYVVLHGQLTPGGGFQGGAAVATGALTVWLAAGFARFGNVFPKTAVESFETLGVLGYVGLGVGALLASGSFLKNVLPLGRTGDLFSSGTIDALNGVVGIAIAGGFIVLFAEFLKETRETHSE
ncbi:MAG: sodium:proton antiporter [Candidatus Eremiobacteraeota bacterium]|nr:sodium:proton antiporter [Candidatus Eremiobacteraeota bacterium]